MRIIRSLKIICCNPLTKQGTHPPSACLPPVMADSLLHKVAPSHCWIVVRTRRFFHVPNGHLLPWHCCVIHRRMHLTSQTPGSFPWGYRYEVHPLLPPVRLCSLGIQDEREIRWMECWTAFPRVCPGVPNLQFVLLRECLWSNNFGKCLVL